MERSTKGWKIYPPDKSKGLITIHGSPSDSRAMANVRAQLKKAGAPLD